jgi:hypothetical protein
MDQDAGKLVWKSVAMMKCVRVRDILSKLLAALSHQKLPGDGS